MALDVTHVLWTGGWDSTFRVLDLLLDHGATVQPHYVFDTDRRSARHEVRAMMRIKSSIAHRDPAAALRLLPLRITAVEEIAPNPEITAQWKAMRHVPLHQQYDWLNRYVAEHHLEGIEIGLTRDNVEIGFGVETIVSVPAANGAPSWALPRDHGNPALVLFERFTFPLLAHLKVELRHQARERRFDDALLMSWFCHKPIGDEPCGFCLICRSSVAQGMGFRLSPAGRFRHRFWKVFYLLRAGKERPDLIWDRLKHPKRMLRIREFDLQ